MTIANERAWARGVSDEAQERARALFAQANAHLKESLFPQAASKYREALAIWDHPGIHYNLALALINLDQPLEVREHLRQALQYGPAPLDEEKFDHARSYLRLVEQQLASIEITCNVEGATVKLDQAFLFRGPGHYGAFVRPGQHRIQATKTGFAATEHLKTVMPGQVTTIDLRLYTEDELTRYRRRWSIWAPVGVTAGGVALAVAGGILLAKSKSRFEQFDSTVDKTPDCLDDGCIPSPSMRSAQDRAKTYQVAGALTLGIGAAALATGAVLFILNAPVAYRVTPEASPIGAARFELEPVLGQGFAGLRATGSL